MESFSVPWLPLLEKVLSSDDNKWIKIKALLGYLVDARTKELNHREIEDTFAEMLRNYKVKFSLRVMLNISLMDELESPPEDSIPRLTTALRYAENHS